MPLILIRHARAGDRATWVGDDRLRPLDEKGRRQADKLVALLRDHPITRIVSSPYLRCVQTVEPLAVALGLIVEPAGTIAEGADPRASAELLRELARTDGVACVHGGIELALGSEGRLRKSRVWLLDERLTRLRILR